MLFFWGFFALQLRFYLSVKVGSFFFEVLIQSELVFYSTARVKSQKRVFKFIKQSIRCINLTSALSICYGKLMVKIIQIEFVHVWVYVLWELILSGNVQSIQSHGN